MKEEMFKRYSDELWNLADNDDYWRDVEESRRAHDTLLRQAILIGASNDEGC